MNLASSQSSPEQIFDEANIKDGKWSQEEHNIFLAAIQKHGCEWKLIADEVLTRTASQVRSHAQKYFNKQQNDQEKIGKNKSVIIGLENEGTSTRAKLRVKEVPTKPKETSSQPAYKKRYDPDFVTPQRKKDIPKEKKIAKTVQRTNRRLASNNEKRQELRKQMITIPAFTWKRSKEEREEVRSARSINSAGKPLSTEVEPSYFIQNIVPKLNERGLDWSGVKKLDLYELIDGLYRKV